MTKTNKNTLKNVWKKPLAALLGLSILASMSTACLANKKHEQAQAKKTPLAVTKEEAGNLNDNQMREGELKKNFVFYESLCGKTKTYLENRWLYNQRLNVEQERILREADSFFRNKEKQKLLDAFKKNPSKCSDEEKEIWQEFLGHMKAFQKLDKN